MPSTYGIKCRYCPAYFAIKGRRGHTAAYTRLEDHVYEAHPGKREVLDSAYDYNKAEAAVEQLEYNRQERLFREGVQPVPIPDDAY